MLLHHGSSNREIKEFAIFPRTDNPPEFGDGVYFTSNFDQAKEWSCKYSKCGAVYTIDIDLSELNGLNLMDESYEDPELYYYLAYLNRIDLRGIARECLDELSGKDFIYGKMIKHPDCFKVFAEEFNSGNITMDKLRETTFLFENYDQYCFISDYSISFINTRCKIFRTDTNRIIKCKQPVEL